MGRYDHLVPVKNTPDQPSVSGRYDHLIPNSEAALRAGGSPPVPGEDIANDPRYGSQEPRFGDFLKPYFGHRNPIAETYDNIIEPFTETSSDRPASERLGDTAAFVGSIPNQMFRLPSVGTGVESTLGYSGLREAEERFTQNNPRILGALGAIGEAAPGITRGLGQGLGRVPAVRRPRPQEATPTQHSQGAPLPSSGPARARQYVQDLDELGISRHGPAVAQASRDGAGLGVVAKTIESMPVVSGPLRRSTNQFIQSTARSADDLAQRYSRGGGNIERAGATVRDHFERFKNERTVARDAIDTMPDAQLRQLASRPPREVGSLKTATDARYELAWRNIPEHMRRGRASENQPRLMGDLPTARTVLQDIQGRNTRMTVQTGVNAAPAAATAPIANSGLLGQITNAVGNSRWRATLQTMRDVRSTIRRIGSRTADTEANTLSRADMARLESAVTQDMQSLMRRIADDAHTAGDAQMAAGFERAISGFRSADQFTRRYAEAFDGIKRLTGATRDAQAIGAIISAAKTGSRGDSQMLTQLRRMAPDDVMDDVASAVINELGRPTGRAGGVAQDAQWSIGKFSSQWNDLNATGRRAIFGHRPQLFARLNKFARVSQGMADYEALANTSKSGTHGIVGAVILAGPSALIGNINGVVMSGLGAYGAAKWMTSPAYVSWLTRSTMLQRRIATGQMRGQQAEQAVRGHVARLRDMLKKDRTLDPQMVQSILIGLGNRSSDQN